MRRDTQLLAVAQEAVGVAASMVRSGRPGTTTAKGDRDPVTDVDLAVERRIRRLLAEATPDIGFLGEEEGRSGDDEERPRLWALDPIDGTVNYAAGSPLCAVSLALFEESQPVLGVIDLPFLGQRYRATKGGGAFLNDEPIRMPSTTEVGGAVVALGDFAVGPDAHPENGLQLRLTGLLAERALRVRMLGSAAIDLAWLAAGHHQASVTLCNRAWDMGAGVVIAREAGAAVVDVDGCDYSLASLSVVAANPGLLPELIGIAGKARGMG